MSACCALFRISYLKRVMASPGPGPSGDSGPPVEVAAEVPFHDVCSLMERVQKTSGLEKKKKILASFLVKWREEHNRLHPTDADTTVSFTLDPYVSIHQSSLCTYVLPCLRILPSLLYTVSFFPHILFSSSFISCLPPHS